MREMVRRVLVLSVIAVCLLAPRTASAITVDQIVALAKAGVTDTVILALIDRDRTVFAIEPEHVVSLQRDGVSENVVLAMLKSGRAEGEQAARADAAQNAAWIMSALSMEANTVIVGHGPDRPNTPHVDGFYSGPPSSGVELVPPPYVPAFRSGPSPFGARRPAEPRALCYAHISTPHATNQRPFVTVCPEVMQPRRLRR